MWTLLIRIDEEVLIGSVAHGAAHRSQPVDELRDRKLELADKHTAWLGDRKAEAVGARCQREREIRNQQRLPTFGSPPTNRMPCAGNSPGSTRHGGGAGDCCSRSCANERTDAGGVMLIIKPRWWRPAESPRSPQILCAPLPAAARSSPAY